LWSGLLAVGDSASHRWPVFDTVTTEIKQASDHAATWAEIDLA
jgi:endonuclease/exonuclease/phosphatase family metal-dependent hydrolase